MFIKMSSLLFTLFAAPPAMALIKNDFNFVLSLLVTELEKSHKIGFFNDLFRSGKKSHRKHIEVIELVISLPHPTPKAESQKNLIKVA